MGEQIGDPQHFPKKRYVSQCGHKQNLTRTHTVGQQTAFRGIALDRQLRSLGTIHSSTWPQVLCWKQIGQRQHNMKKGTWRGEKLWKQTLDSFKKLHIAGPYIWEADLRLSGAIEIMTPRCESTGFGRRETGLAYKAVAWQVERDAGGAYSIIYIT